MLEMADGRISSPRFLCFNDRVPVDRLSPFARRFFDHFVRTYDAYDIQNRRIP